MFFGINTNQKVHLWSNDPSNNQPIQPNHENDIPNQGWFDQEYGQQVQWVGFVVVQGFSIHWLGAGDRTWPGFAVTSPVEVRPCCRQLGDTQPCNARGDISGHFYCP